MLPSNFHKRPLKERYNYLLKDFLSNYKKPQCNLYKNSKHNAGFISSNLKKIGNHRFDSAEGMAKAIDSYVLIHIVPHEVAEEVYSLVESVIVKSRNPDNEKQK